MKLFEIRDGTIYSMVTTYQRPAFRYLYFDLISGGVVSNQWVYALRLSAYVIRYNKIMAVMRRIFGKHINRMLKIISYGSQLLSEVLIKVSIKIGQTNLACMILCYRATEVTKNQIKTSMFQNCLLCSMKTQIIFHSTFKSSFPLS